MKPVYVIQLWDDRLGWVMVSHNGRPITFFRKVDAAGDLEKMRENSHHRQRFEARRFESANPRKP